MPGPWGGICAILVSGSLRFMRCSACIPPDAGATRCPQSDRRAGAAVPCLHCADTVWKTFCSGRSGGFRSGLGMLRLEACVSTGRLCRPVAGFVVRSGNRLRTTPFVYSVSCAGRMPGRTVSRFSGPAYVWSCGAALLDAGLAVCFFYGYLLGRMSCCRRCRYLPGG